MESSPITSWQIDGKKRKWFIFLGSKITVSSDCSNEIKRHLLLGRKAMTNLDTIKKQRHHFANKGPYSQSYGFSSNHVWMWKLDHKEDWPLKNWRFPTVVLEKTLQSPLDCKKIKPVNPKGNQSWIYLEELILKLKPQYFGHLMSTRKDSAVSKDWGQEKVMTEDEMVGWHDWLNGREFEQALGDSEGQSGGLQSMGSQRAGHDLTTEQQQPFV